MLTTRRKYRFADRASAEDHAQAVEYQLTVHRRALDSMLRQEITWTQFYSAAGPGGAISLFRIGIARATSGDGGIVLLHAQYGDQKPTLTAYPAEKQFHAWAQDYAYYMPSDEEGRAYVACIQEGRDLHWRLQNAE